MPGRTAIAVSEFPGYVQRMMREDEDKNTMLANEYNMTIKVNCSEITNCFSAYNFVEIL